MIRRPLPRDPVEARQLTLFKDLKYANHVFVTNLKTRPWRVWLFYDQRANIEKDIRELLYDYPLAKIPTDDWTANVAFFQIVLFAFNLVLWVKRLCLPRENLHATPDKVRTDYLVLLAQLSHRDNRNVLLLSRGHHQQDQFLAAHKKIARLKLTEKL